MDRGRVILAGGSGLLGARMAQELREADFHPLVLSRSDGDLRWDGKSLGPWVREFEGAAAVVNLSGSPVAARKTPENIRLIRDSRVQTTEAIGKALLELTSPPPVWINASAVGLYGDRADEELVEDSAPGTDLLADICRDWEAAATRFDLPSTRLCLMRIGVVLAQDSPAYTAMATATKMFVGGSLGSGRQWLPWVHIDDIAGVCRWMIEQPARGAYNVAAPNSVRNGDFMAELRRVLRRPWSPPAPEFALRLAAKVMPVDPTLALASQRVVPKRLLDEGYAFRYSDVRAALQSLI
jgi:uncharacterized protein